MSETSDEQPERLIGGKGWYNWFKKFRRPSGVVAQQSGKQFEDRVAKLFRQAGKWNVQQSVKLTDRHGNTSEIDVVYGLFFKRYIECKTYSSKLVPLSDVAKFKEVLHQNRIPIQRGIFITTGGYAPRCTESGLECWDGRKLEREEIRAAWKRTIKSGISKVGILTIAGVFVYSVWDNHNIAADKAEDVRNSLQRSFARLQVIYTQVCQNVKKRL